MAETLKPCPFCGGEAHIKEVVSACSVVYTVGCSDSECMGFETLLCKTTPEEAIEAWNRRAERTCRIQFDDQEYRYRCSRCGCLSETYRSTDGKWYAPEYCPHCGARVVSE